ncbi:NADH-quinone oxidoreductase subunit NuoK [Kroppenstedtia eburnea]|uniref:NADH-quinone oxidoreductase subunit K n=1 Tax=Kroppenstedtia eburnea TaxID=714067 RepID=A0A1N7JN03_9BACL|nr:NADH-quinone oxidoreductase subunit NuoK [Kroppenstedtia eburnea]EGK10717.1 NADH-quinone oxidoreductase subunit K [Desmospora sp. 8437]QKI83503.1 NADH-quinone oxidoreductase subunit NuoK [Kroppenstedtia eburnea]SIS50753.1 NADH dehydrogenase subunit K [Kroppenstedtia eburnea]
MPVSSYLALAAILFSVGLYGVLTKRNAVVVLFCIELMLNAVNINLVAFAKYGLYANQTGQVFTLFTMTVAAAEAAVGVAILLAIYRNRNTVNVDRYNSMKG